MIETKLVNELPFNNNKYNKLSLEEKRNIMLKFYTEYSNTINEMTEEQINNWFKFFNPSMSTVDELHEMFKSEPNHWIHSLFTKMESNDEV